MSDHKQTLLTLLRELSKIEMLLNSVVGHQSAETAKNMCGKITSETNIAAELLNEISYLLADPTALFVDADTRGPSGVWAQLHQRIASGSRLVKLLIEGIAVPVDKITYMLKDLKNSEFYLCMQCSTEEVGIKHWVSLNETSFESVLRKIFKK